jgi:hypothetical protein
MAGKSLTRRKSRTPEYQVWLNMRKRCMSPNNPSYKNYGGRGIKICDRWLKSYENFFSDMGSRPTPKHSIDRINNDGDYEPGNCRWATAAEQTRNVRRNHMVEYNGCRMTLSDASKLAGFNMRTVRTRIKSGWDVNRALSQPLGLYLSRGYSAPFNPFRTAFLEARSVGLKFRRRYKTVGK